MSHMVLRVDVYHRRPFVTNDVLRLSYVRQRQEVCGPRLTSRTRQEAFSVNHGRRPTRAVRRYNGLFRAPIRNQSGRVENFPRSLIPNIRPSLITRSFEIIQSEQRVIVRVRLRDNANPIVYGGYRTIHLFTYHRLHANGSRRSPLLPWDLSFKALRHTIVVHRDGNVRPPFRNHFRGPLQTRLRTSTEQGANIRIRVCPMLLRTYYGELCVFPIASGTRDNIPDGNASSSFPFSDISSSNRTPFAVEATTTSFEITATAVF